MPGRVIAALVTVTVLCVAPTHAVVLYNVLDLGTLGGSSSYATGINNQGQAVGQSATPGGVTHGFRTAPNSPINPATDDLGTLGGSYSYAMKINNLGQAVGAARGPFAGYHAFITQPNMPLNYATDHLGVLGGTNSHGYGVNDSGSVVGYADMPGNTAVHAFRTSPNQPINPLTDDLGTLGGTNSYAYAINSSGQVVGYSDLPGNGVRNAFRTSPNQPINPLTDDLGSLAGLGSMAHDINDIGQVSGSSHTADGKTHVFRTQPNAAINPLTDDLGVLGDGSAGRAINNAGDIVGDYWFNSSNVFRAFVSIDGGPLTDLNGLIDPASGWLLNRALDINDLGQIVGNGTINGQTHAFLLTPVPEPGSVLMLAAGVPCLLRRRFQSQIAPSPR